jgi:hypothetical protein
MENEALAPDQVAMSVDARRHGDTESGIPGGTRLRQAMRPEIPVLGDQEDQGRVTVAAAVRTCK